MPSSTQTPNRGTQGDSAITERLQNQDVQRCIELCGQCAESCERTSTHCLTLGGDHASAAHQIILRDCANICSTSACFMSRGSEHHSDVCSVCADICEQCAKDCDRLASGDPMMTECARICRECCEMCRTMAAMR